MSRYNLEVTRGVRTRIVASSDRARRTLDERIFVRFPALARAVVSTWSRLPPRSRLRRTFLSRFMRQGYEAANRRDFEVVVLALHPEVEFRIDESPGWPPPDLLGVYRGHEGYVRAWEIGLSALDYKIDCEEVIDLGDRLFAVGRQRGVGRSSGIPVDLPLFQLFTLRRGLVFRQVDFADRNKALEAAGLLE